MAKKKQPDFQPTKLRVGKHLPKGRNVTNTSFKSKKIVTKDQKLKTSAENVCLIDLIRLTHHSNVATKTDALKRIGKYILMNGLGLPTYFTEILNVTGKLLLDFHPKVRQEALNVIKISADFLSDSQMSAFMKVLSSHLDCMMTHIDLSIKKDSLDLLSSLLTTHPNSICHSTRLLNNLLNMISSIKVQKGVQSGNQKRRKLDDNISTTITSVEWRDQVLKLIRDFLEKLVEMYAKQKIPNQDEQKVYYDGTKPLFIQLYAHGGLTPAKFNFNDGAMKSKDKVTEELKNFFSDVVSVASDVVTEEIAGLNLSFENNILRPENVEHLNTVIQVLCCIADWYSMDNQIKDSSFISQMNAILQKKLMKGFCYKMHDSVFKKVGRKSREMSCAHLNLGIGCLYCFFIQGTVFESDALEKEVLCLVADVLNKPQFQDVKTTSFVLKIIRSFFRALANSIGKEKNKYNEEFKIIVEHLCDMAEKDKSLNKEINSFFIDLSLDYDYKFLLDCGVFDGWTHYAFTQMKTMSIIKDTDKMLLKCINLMCSREYPSFMAALNMSNSFKILDLLKLDDEDYQLTAINIITHMSKLPADFLQNVAKFILVEDQVNLKIILKLIRSLYNRFADQSVVSEEEFKEFSRFLVNVAFDVVSVQKAMNKYTSEYFEGRNSSEVEANIQDEYSSDLIHHLFYVQSAYHCTIVPSQQWERHSKIAEVCLECLVIYYDREITMNVTTNFIHEILKTKRTLPVHSVIALLKLATRVYMFEDYTIPNKMVASFCNELMSCSLLYISTVTHKEHPERCKALGIGELQNALELDTEKGYNLCQIIVGRLYDQGIEEVSLVCALRIIKFLRAKNKISSRDVMEFQEIFSLVERYYAEDSLPHAVLAQIYEVLQ